MQSSGYIRQRAAVAIVDSRSVAVIERELDGARWYLLPGGGVDPGESVEAAAVREAHEELGLNVLITGRIGEVRFTRDDRLSIQSYFAAEVVNGEFGTGDGTEFHLPVGWTGGTYRPMWLDLDSLDAFDVRPSALFAALRDRGIRDLVQTPLRLEEVG